MFMRINGEEIPSGTGQWKDVINPATGEIVDRIPDGNAEDVGHAVERTVLAEGCGLVREYAGHGIGRHLHESPQVPNYGKPGMGITLKSRMTICIEPMVMSGKEAVKSLSDGWTVVTVDGSDAAHFEHAVLVTAEGHEILTPWET